MRHRSEILIVGGGVIGLSTAYYLAQRGVSVTIVDRQSVGREASWAGAGMLPPGNLQHAATPEARLRSYSHDLWPDLTEDLRDRTGIDNGYRVCGAVEVCPPDDDSQFRGYVTCWETEQVLVNRLDRSRLERFVPGLHSEILEGVFRPDFGQARNPRQLKALTTACQMMGVEFIEHADALTLTATDGGHAVAKAGQRTFHADRICVTTGSWTRQLLQPLGVAMPVQPVRGQIVQLRATPLPFTCVIEQGRRYMVPRPDGLILVGATEEYVGFEKKNTSQGVSSLLNFAESLVPVLAQAEIVRCWSGLRPGSPDELPFLGQVPGFENLFVGAGHFRSGLQMSPGTGVILADLLTDQQPDIELEGLTCDRLESVCL